MPSADYPSIGFDPAPGNADTVVRLATELRQIAEKIRGAHDAMLRVGHSDGIWRGEAAENFRLQVGELPGYLDNAGSGLQQAAVALGDWASDLESLQQKAKQLEGEALVARQQLARAKSDPGLDEAGRTYTDDAQLAAAQARLDAATDALNRAEQELQAIIDRAKRLLQQHIELANLTAEALNKACSNAPEEGFFEGLGRMLDSLVDGITDLAADIWRVVQDNAHLIGNLSDVIADLSTFIGVIALGLDLTGYGAVAGVPLGALSSALSAVAFAGHTTAYLAGDDSTSAQTIAWDAAGAATLGVGKALRPAAEIVETVGLSSWLGFSLGTEAVGNDSQTTIFDDIQKYWVPDSTDEAMAGVVSPLGLALYKAAETGMEEDRQAQNQ